MPKQPKVVRKGFEKRVVLTEFPKDTPEDGTRVIDTFTGHLWEYHAATKKWEHVGSEPPIPEGQVT